MCRGEQDLRSYVGFVGQPNTLLQCTHLDSNKSSTRTKVSWLINRFQNLWPKRVTMLWHLCQSTLSKSHQIQWVWIHFCCSSTSLLLGADVLRYEICVYPGAVEYFRIMKHFFIAVLHFNCLKMFNRVVCSEMCAWNNGLWLVTCFDHPLDC